MYQKGLFSCQGGCLGAFGIFGSTCVEVDGMPIPRSPRYAVYHRKDGLQRIAQRVAGRWVFSMAQFTLRNRRMVVPSLLGELELEMS